MSRPEDKLYALLPPRRHIRLLTPYLSSSPPDLFYNDAEARKYTTSSRIQSVQAEMTHRALSLLALPSPSLILDIGCGSGLSGEIISSVPPSAGGPHIWVGMDISASMLDVALQRDVEGDLLLADIGQGVPFRAGTFDAAVSVSAVQWLCNAESSGTSAGGRLTRFFGGLYANLRRGGRAVCQFYPRDGRERRLVCGAAVKAGFGAGVLVDGEGTKGEKVYLVLSVGGGKIEGVVEGMEGVDIEEREGRRGERGRREGGKVKGGKAWIREKKEKMERRGKVVKRDSKFSGRKRRVQF
ncbi:hypothetical protein MMC21_004608 [Puttea exsequens]|nr:hypothetical protein [Puttea exsequens]